MWYGTSLSNGQKVNGKAGLSSMNSKSYNAEALAMFDKTVNKKHSINGTVGVVYNNKDVEQKSITGEGFSNKELCANGISQAEILYPINLNQTGEQLFSVLARALYSYDRRYSVTATFRADGSSKFAKGNRFSYFPSFAAAWRINEENFLKDIEPISNMKLRLGWGQVGNQAISPYQILKSYSSVYYSKPDGNTEVGYVSSRIPNEKLKWETSNQYNVGIDLGLFNQRLSMTIDAYKKKTDDLLQEIAIGSHTGYSVMWINNGSIENKGIEFTVEGMPISKKNWTWTIGGNLSINRNKILSLGIVPADFGVLKKQSGYYGANLGNNNYTKFPANVFLVGHSIGLFFGYETNGIMQEEYYKSEDNQKKPLKINNTEIVPGDVFYVDQNEDGVVDESDRKIIGNPNPDFTYAFNTSLQYKNWTLDFTFNGVHGNDIVNANLIDLTDVKNARKNVKKDAYFEAWTVENKSNSYPRLAYIPTGVLCDRYIEDGSYLRLSNLSLSYLMKLKKGKALKDVTFTLTASNLFTITSYTGYDPDVNTFANEIDRIGVEQAAYPSSRSVSLGVVATF